MEEERKVYPEETAGPGCLSIMFVAYWLMMALVAILMVTGFSSCRSVKYVPVESTQKDSVVINYVDSVRYHSKLEIRDSVRIRDSIVVTKDEAGNITNKESWHERETVKQITDSTAYYKDLVNRLLKNQESTKPKIVYVERPLTRMQQLFINIGKVSTGVCLALIAVAVVWLIIRLKRKFCPDNT